MRLLASISLAFLLFSNVTSFTFTSFPQTQQTNPISFHSKNEKYPPSTTTSFLPHIPAHNTINLVSNTALFTSLKSTPINGKPTNSSTPTSSLINATSTSPSPSTSKQQTTTPTPTPTTSPLKAYTLTPLHPTDASIDSLVTNLTSRLNHLTSQPTHNTTAEAIEEAKMIKYNLSYMQIDSFASVSTALTNFYNAVNEGDIEKMKHVWLKDERSTSCLHPIHSHLQRLRIDGKILGVTGKANENSGQGSKVGASTSKSNSGLGVGGGGGGGGIISGYTNIIKSFTGLTYHSPPLITRQLTRLLSKKPTSLPNANESTLAMIERIKMRPKYKVTPKNQRISVYGSTAFVTVTEEVLRTVGKIKSDSSTSSSASASASESNKKYFTSGAVNKDHDDVESSYLSYLHSTLIFRLVNQRWQLVSMHSSPALGVDVVTGTASSSSCSPSPSSGKGVTSKDSSGKGGVKMRDVYTNCEDDDDDDDDYEIDGSESYASRVGLSIIDDIEYEYADFLDSIDSDNADSEDGGGEGLDDSKREQFERLRERVYLKNKEVNVPHPREVWEGYKSGLGRSNSGGINGDSGNGGYNGDNDNGNEPTNISPTNNNNNNGGNKRLPIHLPKHEEEAILSRITSLGTLLEFAGGGNLFTLRDSVGNRGGSGREKAEVLRGVIRRALTEGKLEARGGNGNNGEGSVGGGDDGNGGNGQFPNIQSLQQMLNSLGQGQGQGQSSSGQPQPSSSSSSSSSNSVVNTNNGGLKTMYIPLPPSKLKEIQGLLEKGEASVVVRDSKGNIVGGGMPRIVNPISGNGKGGSGLNVVANTDEEEEEEDLDDDEDYDDDDLTESDFYISSSSDDDNDHDDDDDDHDEITVSDMNEINNDFNNDFNETWLDNLHVNSQPASSSSSSSTTTKEGNKPPQSATSKQPKKQSSKSSSKTPTKIPKLSRQKKSSSPTPPTSTSSTQTISTIQTLRHLCTSGLITPLIKRTLLNDVIVSRSKGCLSQVEVAHELLVVFPVKITDKVTDKVKVDVDGKVEIDVTDTNTLNTVNTADDEENKGNDSKTKNQNGNGENESKSVGLEDFAEHCIELFKKLTPVTSTLTMEGGGGKVF